MFSSLAGYIGNRLTEYGKINNIVQFQIDKNSTLEIKQEMDPNDINFDFFAYSSDKEFCKKYDLKSISFGYFEINNAKWNVLYFD